MSTNLDIFNLNSLNTLSGSLRIKKNSLVISPEQAMQIGLSEDRANYVSKLSYQLQEKQRDLLAIGILVQLINVNELASYKQKLKSKNFLEILKCMYLQLYQPGDVIIQYGEIAKCFRVIVHGKVEIAVDQSSLLISQQSSRDFNKKDQHPTENRFPKIAHPKQNRHHINNYIQSHNHNPQHHNQHHHNLKAMPNHMKQATNKSHLKHVQIQQQQPVNKKIVHLPIPPSLQHNSHKQKKIHPHTTALQKTVNQTTEKQIQNQKLVSLFQLDKSSKVIKINQQADEFSDNSQDEESPMTSQSKPVTTRLITSAVQSDNKCEEGEEQESQKPSYLTKIMTTGQLGQISLSTKMQTTTATVTAIQPTLFLTISAQTFQRHLLKLEMSEQHRFFQFFRGFYFLRHLSTDRIRKLINTMVRTVYNRGQIIVHENSQPTNIFFVYKGTLIIEEQLQLEKSKLAPTIKDRKEKKVLLKVGQIVASQLYGFEVFYTPKKQRVTVSSDQAQLFIVSMKKLLSEAPELKVLIRSKSLEEKMHFRESMVQKQKIILELQRQNTNALDYFIEKKMLPQVPVLMLIDPQTLEVQPGFMRKTNFQLPTKTKQKMNKLQKKSKTKRKFISKVNSSLKLPGLKQITNNKVRALANRISSYYTNHDRIDDSILQTNIIQTEMLRHTEITRSSIIET